MSSVLKQMFCICRFWHWRNFRSSDHYRWAFIFSGRHKSKKCKNCSGDSISRQLFARLELEGSHNTPGKKARGKTSFEGKIWVNGAPSKGAIQSRLRKVTRWWRCQFKKVKKKHAQGLQASVWWISTLNIGFIRRLLWTWWRSTINTELTKNSAQFSSLRKSLFFDITVYQFW